jgi:hypothetical protein
MGLDDADSIAGIGGEGFARWFGGTAIERTTDEDLADGMLLLLRRYRGRAERR